MIRASIFRTILGNKSVLFGVCILFIVLLITIIGPFFVDNPYKINAISRLKPPSASHMFGTDWLGRDVFARTIDGARISLAVGLLVTFFSISIGLFLGLLAGYFNALAGIIMRVMDGLMAIPGVLLAIGLVAVMGATLQTVVTAITIVEIPRVVRIVRSVVLYVREEAFVEAAIIAGTRTPLLIVRHILPNTIPPLLVQGSFIIGSAIIIEAILGFLGAGIPPEVPSWGNIMAEGRNFFQLMPWSMFFPGFFISVTVLAFNILGDGLRDVLDPKIAKRI